MNFFEKVFNKNNQENNKNEVNLAEANAEVLKDKIDIDLDKIDVSLEDKIVINLDDLSETELTGRFEFNYNEITDKLSGSILRIMKTSEKEVQVVIIDKESGIELYSEPFSVVDEDGRDIKISLFDKDDENLGILLERKE